MNRQRVRKLLLVIACLGFGALLVDTVWPSLTLNRARHLLNSGELDKARVVLDKLTTRLPGNAQVLELVATLHLSRNQRAEAEQAIRKLPAGARRSFLEGALAYISDKESAMDQCFVNALKNDGDLDDWMRSVSRIATGTMSSERNRSAEMRALRYVSRRVHPFERKMSAAMVARELYARGRIGMSRAAFAQAWAARDRNVRTMQLGCAAAAVSADFSAAQYYADIASDRSTFLVGVARELELKNQAAVAPQISLDEGIEAQSSLHAFRLAEAWVKCAGVMDTVDSADSETSKALVALDSVISDYPTDAGAQLLKAEIFLRIGKNREAYRLCESAIARTPVYDLFLKMFEASNGAAEARSREAEFTGARGVVAYVPSQAFKSTGLLHRDGSIALYTTGAAELDFEVPGTGDYSISIIASGDRAFGLGPLAGVKLDTAGSASLYVASTSRSCYVFRAALRAGSHHLEITYLNDAERRPDDSQDRNLYLHGVIVTRTGGDRDA